MQPGGGGVKFGLAKQGVKRKASATAFVESDDDMPMQGAALGSFELQRLGDEAAAAGRWSEALRHWRDALVAPAPERHRLHVLHVLHEQARAGR